MAQRYNTDPVTQLCLLRITRFSSPFPMHINYHSFFFLAGRRRLPGESWGHGKRSANTLQGGRGRKANHIFLEKLKKQMEDTENLQELRAPSWGHAHAGDQIKNHNTFPQLAASPERYLKCKHHLSLQRVPGTSLQAPGWTHVSSLLQLNGIRSRGEREESRP